ncbi:UPF0606 protein KIAA1549L-like isoform X5 [Megalops cyprinoides]|uniref:UPF0606 protein KIAA1549L-like isoform X5 n=1 Tax=Megalops cyprinoides TaxID=118141 RepID=UPI001863AFD1|nr:UPF0606 protein KIAA1549L-like isoform X5 [Megalops cyprinoides]
MASSLRGTHNNLHILDISEGDRARALGLLEWIGVGDTGCYWKNGKTPGLDGFFTKCLISVGMLLLVLQSALATDGEGNYEASGFSAPLQDPAASAGPAHLLARLMREEEVSSSVHHTDPPGVAESTREQPAFSSILTMLASTVERPQTLVLSQSSPVISNQTNQWPSEDPARGIEPSSSAPAVTSILSSSSEETTMNDSSEAPVSLLSTSGEGDTSLAKNATTSHTSNTTIFRKAENTSTPVASTAIVRTTQETLTNATLHLTTVTTTNVDSTTEVAKTTTSTTMQPTSTAQMTVTATNVVTTDKITTTTSTMTTTPLTSTISITTQSPKIATPTADLHITSTTEVPLLQCNITEEIWVKTVLSIHLRRNRLDNTLKQNLPKGLTQALQRAFNDSSVHAKVMTLSSVSNMTVGYYVTSGSMVYMPSAVVESFNAYGIDNLMADIKQFVPAVQSLPVTATPWVPSPAINLQLKTVLRFVAPEDDIKSCSFAQRMEQRLENAFAEAESKVLNSYSRLSVQILSTLPSLGSPVVSLIYSVQNGSTTLNGTFSSNLLNQLTTELVGYFLLFPPFIIAEPLEYHNLNTSAATRVYWVITVIQDVDNSSLEGNYQSFASLMEQRLAELFVVAHQEGTRFRRATTVGSYTVQMVSIRRVLGPKSPAEMTYYVQLNGIPLPGTSAAKILNTVDSQTAALTLGYFVQLQAEPVVKDPPNNLWIIAAVLAPIGVVTVIIIIITAVLCRKNKGDFKADAMGNINPRAKTAYRREASYYHQPVQGFDYAKQHLGQQGGDEEALPVTQETMILPLPIRDAPLVQDRGIYQDGSTSKKTLSSEIRKSRLPSEDGSVISNESGKLNSGRGSSVQKVPAQQKMTKEEARKRTDPYDTSSGSLQLISIKPMAAPPCYSHPASSDRSQDSAILNGEVSMALKQKSDIEHYRNKLRLKAKRKGYYDFPAIETNSKSYGLRQRHGHENTQLELNKVLDHEEERASTYVKSRRRHSQMGTPAYRSRQSLNSPGPSGTEMDLLVMRERTRRGIRNSGYDTEPELIEETNVDRLVSARGYITGQQVKGHSETSTLSSQPSIDEVRQQMHLLLEEAFSLASAGHSTGGCHQHHHLHHGPCSPGQPIPYSEVVTSAPGTMSRPRGGLQWVPAYGPDMYQCSPPKPAFRFTQLPDMAMGSPPPPIPPRTGPHSGPSLRRSTSDIGPKARTSESSVPDTQSQLDSDPYVPLTRLPLPAVTADQSMPHYSGNPITAVYAIPANRSGYSGYFAPTPPSSYRSPSWMSYPPEPDDLPHQWADSVPLPGYAEAFPHPRYPQSSPIMLPWQYSQASSVHGILDQPPTPSTVTSQQSLTDAGDISGTSLSKITTSALVKAIREEVAKLAKKQSDMFEFQV